MARKRERPPVEPPQLSVVGSDVENKHPAPNVSKAQQMTMSPEQFVTPEFTYQLFRRQAYHCTWMNEHTFVAMDHEGRKISVQTNCEFYLISLSMPLAFHKEWSKEQKLSWINSQMESYPHIRLYLREYGDGIMSVEYSYLHSFEESHFMGVVRMALYFMSNIYQTDKGLALRKTF